MTSTDSFSSDAYTVKTVPLPDDVRASIIQRMTEETTRELGKPWLNSLILFGFFFLLLGSIAYFTRMDKVFTGFMLIASAILPALLFFGSREGYRRLDQEIEKVKTVQNASLHTLSLDGPHKFVFHEHGLLVLAALGPGLTFFYDISSAADDPWDQPVNAAYEAGALRRQWVWYELTMGWPSPLVMTGEKLTPSVYEEELDDDFFDFFGNEWNPENNVARLDFEDFLRHLPAKLAQKSEKAPSEA